MTFTVEADGPQLHVTVRGELDLACMELFDGLFDVDTHGIDRVVLHLDALTFCDVTGLNALDGLRAYHASEGRTVELVAVLPQVRRLTALIEALPRAWRRGTAPA